MSDIKQLNAALLNACTNSNINLGEIEKLLEKGARPMGCVESYGNENLYTVVLEHFIEIAFDDEDDSAFFEITKLFLRYGMDLSKPEVLYDPICGASNPLWTFAFYSTETAMKSLEALLDNGLDADLASYCWEHELGDLYLAEFTLDEIERKLAAESFRKVMLIASYPHIISEDEELQKNICYMENNYDITKFRNWEMFDYLFETGKNNQLNNSVVKIVEKSSNEVVWQFKF